MAKNCTHHWLIAPADGPTSEGVCCRCGERRMFKNSRPDGRKLSAKERRLIGQLLGYVPHVSGDTVALHPWRKG
jgi:hypothetical protein